MKNVSKKLLWQQGVVAQYAEIDLDVAMLESESINIILPDHLLSHWSDAIRFAVSLFSESFAWQQPAITQMTVRILSIKAVPGDTTLFSLAYVTFHALCTAWNVDGEQIFAFDQSSGNYLFKIRAA